ncbi:FaeA/PapI family transcriptional regulator [Serratia oryzae]|uniref:FaeA-like family protein n=1 Tax=Serratia oryzae TaxID=2034155 RepID=A0A1S8CFB6_9GAMM|nr:FaeA/PapI family transcriptional regulator [Serratia oryzae]OMQ18953.1 hypothetical protein BMI79_21570 [Serratia oryzae]
MTNKYNENNGMERVLMALQSFCNFTYPPDTLPPQELWPKTRHIADACNMDIYISRHYLMKLVKNNMAYMSTGSINNSLRWYIATPASLSCVTKAKPQDVL